MSHVRRLRLADRIFFVNANLRPRVNRFVDSEYPVMIEALAQSRDRLAFLLCGYVLMPDHWHALIWPSHPLLTWFVLHDIKKGAARKLHACRGRQGPLWQHQFWDRFVRHEKEFTARLKYMYLNPVRKGLVKRPQDWRWSNCNNFALDHSAGSASR